MLAHRNRKAGSTRPPARPVPRPAADHDRDTYYLRRRVNLIMAILFLALNLILLAIVLPAFVHGFSATLEVITLPTPDHR